MAAFWNRKAAAPPPSTDRRDLEERIAQLERIVRSLQVDWSEFADSVLKRMKRTETAARKLEQGTGRAALPDGSDPTPRPAPVSSRLRPVDLRRRAWREREANGAPPAVNGNPDLDAPNGE